MPQSQPYPIRLPATKRIRTSLYLQYIATTRLTTTATYADITAAFASHTVLLFASRDPQANLNNALRRETCLLIKISIYKLLQADTMKYLCIHLD